MVYVIGQSLFRIFPQVGTSKILGRIHVLPLRIAHVYLATSVLVLAPPPPLPTASPHADPTWLGTPNPPPLPHSPPAFSEGSSTRFIEAEEREGEGGGGGDGGGGASRAGDEAR